MNDLYVLRGGCLCSAFDDVDDVTCAWESMYKDILDGYIYWRKIFILTISFLPDELFSKKVPRRSLRAVNQMVIPKGPGPN